MLSALEHGVKGGKWYSLMDEVYSLAHLRAARTRVYANHGAAGIDRQSVELFAQHTEAHLMRLRHELQTGTYRPLPVRHCWVPKPNTSEQQPLGIPSVRDRVVQTALRHVLEPLFERTFAAHSYGFRPGRGCKDALRRVVRLLKAGYTWVVDADVQGYFDTIPHAALLDRVRTQVADGRVLDLVRAYLKVGVLDGLSVWEPECGTPQGAVVSPLLAKVYLDPLDHALAAAGYEMVRYADNFVILCRSRAAAQAVLRRVRAHVEEAGLTLHPRKTQIVDATEHGGFDFLGCHFERGHRKLTICLPQGPCASYETLLARSCPSCDGQEMVRP